MENAEDPVAAVSAGLAYGVRQAYLFTCAAAAETSGKCGAIAIRCPAGPAGPSASCFSRGLVVAAGRSWSQLVAAIAAGRTRRYCCYWAGSGWPQGPHSAPRAKVLGSSLVVRLDWTATGAVRRGERGERGGGPAAIAAITAVRGRRGRRGPK